MSHLEAAVVGAPIGRAARWCLSKVHAEVARSYQYAQPHIRFLSMLVAVLAPALYPVDWLLFDATYDTLGLRMLGGFAGLVCLFSDREPLLKFAPWIWLAGVSVVFHVMLPSMLTLNAATTPVGGEVHIGWTTSYLVGLFCFVLVINGWIVSLLSWLCGSIVALCLVFTVTNPNWGLVFDSFVLPTGIWLSAIVVGSYANRSLRVVESSKTRTARAVAGNIAHELRTPLSGMVARARGASALMPELWEGYRAATHPDGARLLSKSEVEEAGNLLLSITEEAQFANTVINLLLDEAASRRGWTLEPEAISAAGVLAEVLDEYPWPTPDRRGNVSVDLAQDFTFRASRLICRYVLRSLLNLALEAGEAVSIRISASTSGACAGLVRLIVDAGEALGDDAAAGGEKQLVGGEVSGGNVSTNVSNRTLREIHAELLATRRRGKISTIELRIERLPIELQD